MISGFVGKINIAFILIFEYMLVMMLLVEGSPLGSRRSLISTIYNITTDNEQRNKRQIDPLGGQLIPLHDIFGFFKPIVSAKNNSIEFGGKDMKTTSDYDIEDFSNSNHAYFAYIHSLNSYDDSNNTNNKNINNYDNAYNNNTENGTHIFISRNNTKILNAVSKS